MKTIIWISILIIGFLAIFGSIKAQNLLKTNGQSSVIEYINNGYTNIGIGTPYPGSKLHIQNESNISAFQADMTQQGESLTVHGSLLNWYVSASNVYYGIYQTKNASSSRVVKNYFQNCLGIGMEPIHTLDVYGTIGCKSFLCNGQISFIGDSATGINISNNDMPFVFQYYANENIVPDTLPNEDGSGSITYPLKIYSYGIEASYLKCTSTITTNNLQIKSNAHAGSVLMSYDVNGNSVWTPPSIFKIYNTGQVSIGADAIFTDYKLAVNGKIRCKEMKVTLNDWPDYVFNKDYKLYSLKEVDQFIQKNKHLPDMPSAGEVNEQGVNLGEMNARLVKKVEELTLYLIAMQKEIEELKSKLGSR